MLWFIQWFLTHFSTAAHFRRFLGTFILTITVVLISRDRPMPEGWWLAVGAVIGFFFKSGRCADD